MPETTCVFLIVLGIVHFGFCFRSDQMHEQCGSILDAKSGQVVFYADKLPSHVTSCNITLTSEPCQDCHNVTTRLIFYFTRFNMLNDCKNINNTLLNGDGNSSLSIYGLSDTLCGQSKTILKENCVFTSESNNISVSFTRSDVEKPHAATLSFVYSSFHTDVCDSSNEVKCWQGNATHLESDCSDEMIFCAILNDTICFSKSETGQSNKTVKYIVCSLLGVFALFALKCIYQRYMKGEGGGMEDCLSSIKTRVARTLHMDTNICLCTSMTNSSIVDSCSDSTANRDTITANIRQTSTAIQGSASEAYLVISPSAPALEEIDGEVQYPPPPPTYDESTVPSYNEVMTHQDKYIVH